MGARVGKRGPVSEINVTPFVDVMLVLLIIFMVTAPMMDQGLEVDLPQTKKVDSLPTEDDHLVLTVREDGSCYIDSYRVGVEELEERIALLVKEKGRQLFLQADQKVPYGVVVDIMGRIRSGGVEQLGILALPSPEGAAPADSEKTRVPADGPQAGSAAAR